MSNAPQKRLRQRKREAFSRLLRALDRSVLAAKQAEKARNELLRLSKQEAGK